jgi:hypothetical protein
MPQGPEHWRPRNIRRFIETRRSATSVARVETDAGEGFLKALGNPAGPHALACEWVGTKLADRFGLPTLDYALIDVTADDEIPLCDGGHALPGPAFITRAEKAYPWGGDTVSLEKLSNREDIAKLIVFDTWTRNCDRYPPAGAGRNPHRDNVLLSREGAPRGRFILKAMDQTHCFTCGRELTRRISGLDTVQDSGVYGLFPEFRPLIAAAQIGQDCARLRTITRPLLETIVASVPAAWALEDSARRALVDFLVARADFVAGTLVGAIFGQGDLGF